MSFLVDIRLSLQTEKDFRTNETWGGREAQWDNSGVQTTITYFTQYFMEISVSMASEGHV